MIQDYLLADAAGTVINIILWDGVTPFDPGEGCTLTPQPGGVDIGWRRAGEGWAAPEQTP